MSVILNLFMIAVIMVNLLDLSGFIEELEKGIWKRWFHKGVPIESVRIPKPFSCSYCMTHHIGLLYLIISGRITLYYYCALLILCFLTPIMGSVMIFLKDICIKVIDTLYRLLKIS